MSVPTWTLHSLSMPSRRQEPQLINLPLPSLSRFTEKIVICVVCASCFRPTFHPTWFDHYRSNIWRKVHITEFLNI